jgi:hypothetical protein
MRMLLIGILSLGYSAFGQTQATSAVNLKPGSTGHAVITVCASALCTGGIPSGYFKATVNASPTLSWRLVYEGTTATALFQSNGYTYTVRGLYVGLSQADCVAFAATNAISIPSAVLNPTMGNSAP